MQSIYVTLVYIIRSLWKVEVSMLNNICSACTTHCKYIYGNEFCEFPIGLA
jgi:hypothetical protein